ncbi:hypothetical protein H3146_06950 [Streptomyces sp. OF3]|uniref:Uncharacterized protein n=1 Tax=Streptomyces alkaliterrae TaxID=2213162 RepID=A0A7W3ZLV6_9ACTN|nr:hypothetical protein [Streptomyces alkaliterrae]MBB1253108.1 hypothetical protein [Streptomyces alkaliterrae]
MRPTRFQDFALDLAKNSPDCGQARTLADTGVTKYPYGLSATASGREIQWQFIAQSRDGDKFTEPETITKAEQPISLEAVPDGGLPEERWFAELLARSGSEEITAFELWSPRPNNRKGHDGVTVFFADSARIYARVIG